MQDPHYKVHTPQLIILARRNQYTHARLGFIISSKSVRHATLRNRIKRQLRSSFRDHYDMLPHIDIVAITRRPAPVLPRDAQHKAITAAMTLLIHKTRGT